MPPTSFKLQQSIPLQDQSDIWADHGPVMLLEVLSTTSVLLSRNHTVTKYTSISSIEQIINAQLSMETQLSVTESSVHSTGMPTVVPTTTKVSILPMDPATASTNSNTTWGPMTTMLLLPLLLGSSAYVVSSPSSQGTLPTPLLTSSDQLLADEPTRATPINLSPVSVQTLNSATKETLPTTILVPSGFIIPNTKNNNVPNTAVQAPAIISFQSIPDFGRQPSSISDDPNFSTAFSSETIVASIPVGGQTSTDTKEPVTSLLKATSSSTISDPSSTNMTVVPSTSGSRRRNLQTSKQYPPFRWESKHQSSYQ